MSDVDSAADEPRRPSKGDLAAGERDARRYQETYGRGGGERYASETYPRSYAVPGRLDWRRALRAYVTGHDRGWEADRKQREAGRETAARPPPAREESPFPEPGPELLEEDAAEADATTAETAEGTRFGVPVPDRLEFHRGASTWRDRLPDAGRLPRHGSRSARGPGRPGDRRGS